MNAPLHAAAPGPSAEMLLYLAEFADEDGQPEDPVALAGHEVQDAEESAAESRDEPSHEPAQRTAREVDDD
jgi:hypothetical protein